MSALEPPVAIEWRYRRTMLHARRLVFPIAFAACIAACGSGSPQGTADAAPAGAASSPSAGATRPLPAADRFTATVAGTAGRRRGDTGRATISLQPRGSSASRPVTVVLHGTLCERRASCVSLAGTLHGTLTAARTVQPDRGRMLALAATGTVTFLGRVRASGTVTGTGNIRSGRESLRLTLRAASGTVMLSGRSGPVGPFTTP